MLHDFWFLLIAVLWIGYFVLEVFDFGVGILQPILGKTDKERRAIVNTIGPVWDGNEVWVLVAGGATFAAFPNWYATLFAGFYLPLFLILVSLIVRGVAFEYRSKRESATWRRNWDIAIFIGSAGPALLWGVAFANIVAGTPIDKTMTYTGDLFTLLNPFGLLGGVVTLSLFITHGAAYLALKTTGDLRARANKTMGIAGIVAAVAAVAFLVWAQLIVFVPTAAGASVLAALALVGALLANRTGREGWAFIGSGATLALAVVALFLHLYPNVMRSSTDPAFNLTITNASSTDYTLTIMTIVAVIFVPIVLIYQGWTYYVFRKRISADRIPDVSEFAAPPAGF